MEDNKYKDNAYESGKELYDKQSEDNGKDGALRSATNNKHKNHNTGISVIGQIVVLVPLFAAALYSVAYRYWSTLFKQFGIHETFISLGADHAIMTIWPVLLGFLLFFFLMFFLNYFGALFESQDPRKEFKAGGISLLVDGSLILFICLFLAFLADRTIEIDRTILNRFYPYYSSNFSYLMEFFGLSDIKDIIVHSLYLVFLLLIGLGFVFLLIFLLRLIPIIRCRINSIWQSIRKSLKEKAIPIIEMFPSTIKIVLLAVVLYGTAFILYTAKAENDVRILLDPAKGRIVEIKYTGSSKEKELNLPSKGKVIAIMGDYIFLLAIDESKESKVAEERKQTRTISVYSLQAKEVIFLSRFTQL